MSVFCNLGRTPWVYRAFSYQRLFADAEKGPMQIALGQSDICEFESYMPSHAVRSPPLSTGALSRSGFPRPAMPPARGLNRAGHISWASWQVLPVRLSYSDAFRRGSEAPIFAKNGFWAPCVRAKGARAFPPGVTLLKRHPPDIHPTNNLPFSRGGRRE